MLKRFGVLGALILLVLSSFVSSIQGQGRRVAVGDWPEVRGPHRDGTSTETGLPDRWALNGENFLWRASFGGRSSPVVMANRVCVQNPSGRGADLQERVMCLDADTGKLLWEYKFNVFQSDVPPHRVGWASPAADPETGNLYALGGGAFVVALTRDGKLLWERSVGEEFAAFTTHGGRTASPLVDGDLVIVSAAVSNWGSLGARQHRFIALDKRTGDIVYVASPGGRPYDTNYSMPLIATINGMRLLISGSGDGAVHAIKPQTGEKVWSYLAAKRAINTGVVVSGTSVIVSHGDENLDTSQMGMIAAIDGSLTGDIKTTKWATKGTEFGFSSPVIDGQRIYQIDNGAVLHGYDLEDGRLLFEHQIGTGQKAPLVMADGKLYVGTENGRFFVLRPRVDRIDVLSEVQLPISTDSVGGSEGTPEQIVSGAAISRGRVFFVSSDAVYAFGPKAARAVTGTAVDEPAAKGEGEPAFLQVSPTELTLMPGQTVKLRARLFDAKGRLLRDATGVAWALQGLKGAVGPDGSFTVDKAVEDQAGTVKATVEALTGEARARVVRPIPWTETFEGYPDGAQPPGWISMVTGKFGVATLDGQKVLQKPADNTLFKRIRVFAGGLDEANYTVEADVRTTTRRRQQGDIGVTAQRYSLILYGNSQRLKLEPWEPETARSQTVAFAWKPDTWYHLKLEVQNLPDGTVRARGKAWPTGDPEPAAWTIEKIDPIGNKKGAAGLFVDAEFGAHIDNFKVSRSGNR
jgi:outer membrane protein assembly factor BamB